MSPRGRTYTIDTELHQERIPGELQASDYTEEEFDPFMLKKTDFGLWDKTWIKQELCLWCQTE